VGQFSGSEQYIASAQLKEIVNISIALSKPLIIRGEPGTGKTQLARAVAASLGLDIHIWNVKSTTKAQDGLYTYDALQRLNDSRFADKDVNDINQYIKWGPLGRAFRQAQQSVVLIDEIDKADVEFPNDLLHEIDAMSFQVYETGELVVAQQRPIVIITSNAEKELPDAFLRRCLFHYIEFPKKEEMADIIRVHHPKLDDALLSAALSRFYWLRQLPDVRKKPSTSELIDWLAALAREGVPVKRLATELPFLGVLLKKEADISMVRR
jgi:MoxR-like ATPase